MGEQAVPAVCPALPLGAGNGLQHLDLRPKPLTLGHSIGHCYTRQESSPSPFVGVGAPTSEAPGWQGAPGKLQALPSIFPPRQLARCPIPAPAQPSAPPSPHPRGWRATPALAEGAPALAHMPAHRGTGTRPSTQHPHARPGVTGSWAAPHQPWGVAPKLLYPTKRGTLLAITATLLKTQPLHSQSLGGKRPGRAGSSARRWKCWLRPCLDLWPISRAGSPPLLRGQPCSFFTTTLQQPQVCVNPPRLSRKR